MLEIACIVFFVAYTVVFLVAGTKASRRERKFTKEQEEMLTPREQGLLRAPGLWLSASLMLTWTGKYLVSGSVVSSLIVLVLAVNDGANHIASIAFFSMLGIAMTCIDAFFKCESLAAVYRQAFVLADPYFVRFENRYTSKGWETKGFDRNADFDKLLAIRAECERIIAGAYGAA